MRSVKDSIPANSLAVAMDPGLLRCILIGCCTVYIAWFCLLIFSIGCPDKYKEFEMSIHIYYPSAEAISTL